MSLKIILVVGAARSGSTIVSMKLAQKFGFGYFGELNHFWDRGLQLNHLCGCGSRFLDCTFWNRVCEEVGVKPNEGSQIKKSVDQILAARFSINPFSSRRPAPADEVRTRELVERLYRSLASMDEPKVIVDSSKQPIYARFLIDIFGRERVQIVHLVRDPRGVAYSLSKKKPKLDSGREGAYMIRRNSFRSALEWLKINYSATRLEREVDDYHVLSYEEFCNDPDGTLSRLTVADAARAPSPPGKVTFHTVSGNPVRVSADLDRLKTDTEWKDNMPPLERFIVSLIVFPLRFTMFFRKFVAE